MVGDSLTLSDIAVAAPFANLEHMKVEVDEQLYPKTLAFARRMLARPSFSDWIERERRFFAKLGA